MGYNMTKKIIVVISIGLIMIFFHNNRLLSQNNQQSGIKELLTRDQVEDKYKWNLKDIYPDEEKWKQDFDWIEVNLKNYKQFEGKLAESLETLLAFLKFDEEVGIKFQKVRLYASLSKDLDLANTKYMAMFDNVMNLSSKLLAISSFFRPEILSIPREKLEKFITMNKELGIYKHFFDDIVRLKPHTLEKSKEEMLAMALPIMQTPYNIFAIFKNADMQYPVINDENGIDIKLSDGRFYAAIYSSDRSYRERAYMNYYKPYIEYKNTLATLFNSQQKALWFNSQVRKYESALVASLSENNINKEVYYNLMKTVNENLAPQHRWCSLRKRVLGVDEFHVYDTYVSLFAEQDKKYSYEEAVELIIQALKPLSEDYIKYLKYAFDNRWVDVFETKGKRSGAYSTGSTIGVHPFVLMNWNGTLNDVFTLAHEMGHNMHSLYSANNQPYVYADYPIFLAEVASTLNEALLLDYMIKNAKSKSEKMALIERYITNIMQTFYRQTQFAEFEMITSELIQNGESLTPDRLAEIFGDIYQKYWGKEMNMDPEERYCWARIPHFYYNFYVYQYAVCFSASEAIAEKIFNEGEPAIKKYLEFLKSGSSEYPINTLIKAGVDMTRNEPILAVTRKMNQLIDELEKLLYE